MTKHSLVIMRNNGMLFLSRRLNISRIMDTKFHMASGSLPRSGRNKLVYSAAVADDACSKHSTSLTTLGVGMMNLMSVLRTFSCKMNSSKHHTLMSECDAPAVGSGAPQCKLMAASLPLSSSS